MDISNELGKKIGEEFQSELADRLVNPKKYELIDLRSELQHKKYLLSEIIDEVRTLRQDISNIKKEITNKIREAKTELRS